MNQRIPHIEPSWRAVAVRIAVPEGEEGWITEFDFKTPAGTRRIRFVTSERYTPLWDLLHGFDEVRITDQNAGGRNHLEYGRYLVEVIVDGDCVPFFADEVE